MEREGQGTEEREKSFEGFNAMKSKKYKLTILVFKVRRFSVMKIRSRRVNYRDTDEGRKKQVQKDKRKICNSLNS